MQKCCQLLYMKRGNTFLYTHTNIICYNVYERVGAGDLMIKDIKGTVSSRSTGHGIGMLVLD